MTGRKQTELPDLVRAIQRAWAEDKKTIDRKIEEVQKELDTLKQESRLRETKLNGKPVRAATGQPRGAVAESRREKVYDYLVENGPAHATAIAAACEIPRGSIDGVLRHEWFTKAALGQREEGRGPAVTRLEA